MTKRQFSIILTALFLLTQTIVSAEVVNNSRFADLTQDDLQYEDNFYEVSHKQINEPRTLQDDRRDSFTTKVINSGHYTPTTATKTWIPIHRVDTNKKLKYNRI